MAQFVLLMYQPAEGGPAPEDMADEHKRWMAFAQDLKDAGLYRANNGLRGVEAATTVRVRAGEAQVTDGPFAETKEMLAGYWLIEADELDTALEWAGRMPIAEYGSVEVRPVWG